MWVERRSSPKLTQQIDAVAEALLKLQGLVAGISPAALVVVVPTGYAYTRPDGVRVVPLSLLGP